MLRGRFGLTCYRVLKRLCIQVESNAVSCAWRMRDESAGSRMRLRNFDILICLPPSRALWPRNWDKQCGVWRSRGLRYLWYIAAGVAKMLEPPIFRTTSPEPDL